MTPEMIAALIGLVGALLGSAVAGFYAAHAAIKAVDRGFERLEHQEIRRMRVECVVNMAGARFVLDRLNPNNEDQARLDVELNKLPVLFADAESVMQPYRLYAANPGEIANFYPLMEALIRAVRISGRVERQDIERILRVL